MSMETFEKCIEVVQMSDNPEYGGKKFVWLNHFGEPLLNPLLPQFVSYAVSQNIEVSFASNGVDRSKEMFPRDLWKELAEAGLKGVMISAHAKSLKTLTGHIDDIVPIVSSWVPKPENCHDWVGQVELKQFETKATPAKVLQPCDYENHNMFAVKWDGKLAACCYDIEGSDSISVDDVLADGFRFRRISLCDRCSLGRGDVNWLLETLVKLVDDRKTPSPDQGAPSVAHRKAE